MSARSVRFNTVASALGFLITGVGASAFELLLANSVDREVYGTFTYLINYAVLFVAISDLGLEGYYEFKSSKEIERLNYYFVQSILMKLGFIIVTLPFFCFIYFLLYDDGWSILLICIVYAIARALFTHGNVVFLPAERTDLWSVQRGCFEVTRLVILAAVVWGLAQTDILSLLMIAAASAVIATGVAAKLITKVVHVSSVAFRDAFADLAPLRELRAMLPFSLFQVAYLAYVRLNVLMLSVYASATDVADFWVCFLFLEFLLIGAKALTQATAPRLSKKYHREGKDEFEKLFRSAMEVALFGAALILVIGWLYGSDVLILAFGDDYANATDLWSIMCILAVLRVIQQQYAGVLNYLGHAKAYTKQIIVIYGLQGVANFFLLDAYGVVGVALGMTVAGAFLVIANAVTVSRAVGVRPLPVGIALRLLAISTIIISGMTVLDGTHFIIGGMVASMAFIGLTYATGCFPLVIWAALQAALARVIGARR